MVLIIVLMALVLNCGVLIHGFFDEQLRSSGAVIALVHLLITVLGLILPIIFWMK